MRRFFKKGAALCWLAWGTVSIAQDAQSPAAPPSPATHARSKIARGSLSGIVYCADSNMPARLASIILVQISDNSFGSQGYGTSDLEGRFAADHIPEGKYYVVAVLPGYLNLLTRLRKDHLDELSEAERKSLFSEVQTVTIASNRPARASIRLDRGGEIDGTVRFDDGSPAIGVPIHYELRSKHPDSSFGFERIFGTTSYSSTGPPRTDDRGQFRIAGMPPGTYLISTTLPSLSAE